MEVHTTPDRTAIPIVYGDARDGIRSVPQGEALAFWEEDGLTREMFENPGAMTKQEVELFHRVLNQAIIDNWHYFAQAARYRQECAAGERTGNVAHFGPVTVSGGAPAADPECENDKDG